jgi:hypothetical protein
MVDTLARQPGIMFAAAEETVESERLIASMAVVLPAICNGMAELLNEPMSPRLERQAGRFQVAPSTPTQ